MNVAVRCPHCDELSRVPETAVGHYVACPRCARPFSANPEPLTVKPRREVPTVFPKKTFEPLILDEFTHEEESRPHGERSLLIGLALLPLLIPVLWLLGPLLTGKQAIFTYALPIAIAVSAVGLGLGVVYAADWSLGMRVKSIFALLFLASFSAAFLYFLKTEWVEDLRRRTSSGNDEFWFDFQPPDKKFRLRVPGGGMAPDQLTLIDGWELPGHRSTGPRLVQTFYAAYGTVPDEFKDAPADKFFEEVQRRMQIACGGQLVGEPKPVRYPPHPGFEYVYALPDKASKRIVRVIRVERHVFVAAVEGAFLPPDARVVRKYFDTIKLTPGK